jgi:hypothetical protein
VSGFMFAALPFFNAASMIVCACCKVSIPVPFCCLNGES